MEQCVYALVGTLSCDTFLPNMHRIAADASQEWAAFLEYLRSVIAKVNNHGYSNSTPAGGVRDGGAPEESGMRIKLTKMVEELRLLSSPLQMCVASDPQVCCCMYVFCMYAVMYVCVPACMYTRRATPAILAPANVCGV